MRLTHITLQGFKSFAKKVSIDVTHNVTGVVGPNGSGKSNVAEGIRFALGEQSMKSMRGKLGSDLIFKGSNHIAPSSRAIVTLTIDNRKKGDTAHASEDLAPYLMYDELVLSRTIYGDGTSDYTLNNAKVRLKDVQELLAFAGIGSSAHTMISQGEADKILLADLKGRKEAIEDALGLRVYHMRLNESTRKLERTKIHLREVELLRKEIAPHLHHLKKQVEKIESKEKERLLLNDLLVAYLKREESEFEEMKKKIDANGSVASLSLIADSIRKELSIKSHTEKAVIFANDKNELQTQMRELLSKRENLSKNLGRFEAERAYLQKDLIKNTDTKNVNILKDDLIKTGNSLDFYLSKAYEELKTGEKEVALEEMQMAKTLSKNFFDKYKTSDDVEIKRDVEKELRELDEKINKTHEEEKSLNEASIVLQEKINNSDNQSRQNLESQFEEEKKLLLLEAKLREFESMIALRRQEEEGYKVRYERFESLLNEGVLIVGQKLLGYKEMEVSDTYDKMDMNQLLRAIDKSRFRIEEAGIVNAGEVMEEYKTVSEREEYLKKELDDVRQTEERLLSLIIDLQKSLEEKFNHGVKEISKLFTEYFGEVFPGGKASLSVVPIIKIDENGEEVKEQGIDIDVSLPTKKVRELAMFSGGERALISIALLFAMSSLTPPPFMVLDETDAPLDEANTRKYGAMLSRLAEKSRLLVITHNRETMNHCDMLYGVTLGADGSSKLLSISLKD